MGGLLGLFMGFSVISLIELFYFISIRPYCNYLRLSHHRQNISKAIEKLRQKRNSSIITKTVQSNTTIDRSFPYID